MTIVGNYLRNLLAVLITVVGVMFVIQLIQLDRSSRALRDLGASSLNAQLDQQLATRADSIAQVVASNVAAPMLRFDMIGIYDVLLPAASRESVQQVLLLDLDGTVVHDGTHEVGRYGDAISSIAPDVDADGRVAQRLQREDSYAAVVPVFAGVEQIGQVYVALSRSEVATQLRLLHDRFDQIAQERRNANFRATALGGIALTLIGMVLSIIVARRMARPIEQLVAGTKQVARGNYDVSLEVQREDEVGELAAAFTNMSAELAMRNERISSLAFRDSLTGLANRAAFTEAVAQYLGTGKSTGAAVLFMDLDEFKRVNDTLGHEAGDAMLRTLGLRLREALISRNFPELSFEGSAIAPVARWGGDEFSLFLDGVDNVEAGMRLAKELLDELRQPVTIRGMEIVGGASIGVALYPSDGESIAALLGLADVAMYHAKERNDVRIAAYTPAMRESTEDRLAMESDLRVAIERNEFEISYEPLFDPLSESLAGLEAHLLWQHPEYGVMSPESFMPLAESMGFSGQIMDWMIQRTLGDFCSLEGVIESDLELTISLLSSQVERERLIDALAMALEKTALDSRRLILEISEQRLFRNVLHAVPFLTEVRRLGVRVWVDHFGSGYAAINRLRHMPLDGMKLDRSLVAEVDKSPADQSLSSAVIALAHSLGLRVGAANVSNRAQLDFLRRSGCDVVQGSHFGLPEGIDAFSGRIVEPENRRA